jgi:hypothetical protein
VRLSLFYARKNKTVPLVPPPPRSLAALVKLTAAKFGIAKRKQAEGAVQVRTAAGQALGGSALAVMADGAKLHVVVK